MSIFSFKKSKFDKLVNFIRSSKNSISKEDRECLIKLVRPAIGVSTSKLLTDSLKLGHSKIGGNPDLPYQVEWPMHQGSPMKFLAQYNVAEMKKYDIENLLPEQGMFYIFVAYNKTDCKVYFCSDTSNLTRQNNLEVLNVASIKYFDLLTIPDDENYKLESFEAKYDDFYGEFYEETMEYLEGLYEHNIGCMHQILGEDNAIQSSVVYDYAKADLKITTEEVHIARWSEIVESSRNYQTLIQLDCDDVNTNLSTDFGSGVFYIGIKLVDLLRKNFDNFIVAYQTT
jgi:uncharacterized protein YwqG